MLKCCFACCNDYGPLESVFKKYSGLNWYLNSLMSQKMRQNQLFDAFFDLTSKKETIQSWIMREDEGALCEVKSIKNVKRDDAHDT